MKMERVGEKRGSSGSGVSGSSRSIDVSGIPQSVLDRSVPSVVGQLSPNGNSRLNLYHPSPTTTTTGSSEKTSQRAKSPGSSKMTNGRSSHHHQHHPLYSPTSSSSSSSSSSSASTTVAGLPLTKNVGVGVNLTQNRGSSASASTAAATRQQPFVTPQLPHVPPQQLSNSNSRGGGGGGGGGQLLSHSSSSHSPTPISSSGGITNSILPELLQGQSSRIGGKSTSLVPSTTSLMHLAKAGSLSSAQRDLFSNLNPNGNKIVSQNLNGTLAVTSVPTNDSELQLFRVLQKANLLNYFDVMIELGGDDVQQLCDAGEEEFLEIMALIGMASKPLHVRRLQKSLQDWMTQPSLFPGPVLGPPLSAFTGSLTSQHRERDSTSNSGALIISDNSSPQLPIRPIPFHSGNSGNPPTSCSGPTASFLSPNDLKSLHIKFLSMKNSNEQTINLSQNVNNNSSSSNSNSPKINQTSVPTIITSTQQHISVLPIPFHIQSPTLSNGNQNSNNNSGRSPSPYNIHQQQHTYPYTNGVGVGAQLRIPVDQIIPSQFVETRIRTRSEPNSPAGSGSSSESPQLDSRTSLSPIPFLQDNEVQKIADAANKVIQSLPEYMNEPRVTAKRKTCADYETVLRIDDDDPRRMDKIRKYAAIYGRYDCKRKVQKPLTIHELSVNEAASHLCNYVPALLTRRDELFLLSRQVVRDAGLPYSSIISTTSGNILLTQIKNAKHGNTNRIIDDNISNGSSNDSNNSFGGKRLRSGDDIEVEEFNGPRSTPEIDTTIDESVPSKIPKSNSDGQPSSPFEKEETPEIGRGIHIFGTESTVFSPQYDLEVPDDLSLKRHQVQKNSKGSKTYKRHQVKSEPSSS